VLRRFVVTPDMHRVHHSAVPHETNSNFGFNLPWWICSSALIGPAGGGHELMTIGITQFRRARDLWLDRMLVQPVLEDEGNQPLGRREDAAS